jgi:hypothetical protein
MSKEHNYGIDLLRLLLMFMVCVLHVLGQGGILAHSVEGTNHYSIFWLMEILCYCAVDSFALISGYMASEKPCRFDKIINLWFTTFFYAFIITTFFVLIGKADNIGSKDIIYNAFPIINSKYWYMTAYFLLFFSIPILNRFLFSVDRENAKKAFILITILFSFMGMFNDPFFVKAGYSALWLIALYCLGALANRIELFDRKKTITLICFWGLLILITWYCYVYTDMKWIVSYVSPTILFSGIIMVVLFKRIKIKSRFIAYLSSLSLGVYLLQCNQVIWNNIILNAFVYIADEVMIIGILHVLKYAIIIWALGLIVESIRSQMAKLLKLDHLSKKIVQIVDFCLSKI